MAIVGDTKSGRIYAAPYAQQSEVAASAKPLHQPSGDLPDYSQAFPTATYGANTFSDLFTPRQSVAIGTFAELIPAALDKVRTDAERAGSDDSESYAAAVATVLALNVGRLANRSSSFSFWHAGRENVEQPFAQQGFNKTWDFCEANPFSGATGSWDSQLKYASKVIEQLPHNVTAGTVIQRDAVHAGDVGRKYCIVTDPPYYTNIGY